MSAFKETMNIVTINMGGADHNPFEYCSYGSFMLVRNLPEWNYRKVLNGLTKTILLNLLKDVDKKYKKFIEFLDDIDEENLLEYFFPEFNIEHAEKVLELENKFGRKDSNIKRFNPVGLVMIMFFYGRW